MVEDCFHLYLKYQGTRFDLIEKEMRLKGWTTFNKNCLTNRGQGGNWREGWIEKYGWKNALEHHVQRAGKDFSTLAEKLYHEVETIREQLFAQIQQGGVNNRDLIYQHRDYTQRSAELLAQMESTENVEKHFARFFDWLLKSSLKISPNLARELCNAEDAIIKHAKNEFGRIK